LGGLSQEDAGGSDSGDDGHDSNGRDGSGGSGGRLRPTVVAPGAPDKAAASSSSSSSSSSAAPAASVAPGGAGRLSKDQLREVLEAHGVLFADPWRQDEAARGRAPKRRRQAARPDA